MKSSQGSKVHSHTVQHKKVQVITQKETEQEKHTHRLLSAEKRQVSA
jgi:hypothetical protein